MRSLRAKARFLHIVSHARQATYSKRNENRGGEAIHMWPRLYAAWWDRPCCRTSGVPMDQLKVWKCDSFGVANSA